jgi:hypothetical protein
VRGIGVSTEDEASRPPVSSPTSAGRADTVQGYLLAEPMPPDELAAYVRDSGGHLAVLGDTTPAA